MAAAALSGSLAMASSMAVALEPYQPTLVSSGRLAAALRMGTISSPPAK